MKNKKLFIVSVLLCITLVGGLTVLGGGYYVNNRVLAEYNDETVIGAELNEKIKMAEAVSNNAAIVGDEVEVDRDAILEQMVEDIILKEQIELYNITLSDEKLKEIDDTITQSLDILQDLIDNGSPSEKQQAERALALQNANIQDSGLTEDEYYEQVKERLILMELKQILIEKQYDGLQENYEAFINEAVKDAIK